MPFYWTSDHLQYYAACCVGGGVEFTLRESFDTIMVRYQAMPNCENGMKPMYNGALDCFNITINREGYLALFKGATPSIVRTILYPKLFIYGTSVGAYLLHRYYGDHLGEDYTFMQNFFIGAVGGVFTTIITTPTERIKCLLQVQTCDKTENTLASIIYYAPLVVLKKLYNKGGIFNIYHGTMITLIRDVSVGAIFCAVCDFLTKKYNPESRSRIFIPYATIVVASCVYQSITYPADFIKTRIQTTSKEKYINGIQSVVEEVIKHDGPSGVFRGIIPHLVFTLTWRFAVFIAHYSIMPACSKM